MRSGIAAENFRIVSAGGYTHADGTRVELAELLEAAKAGTVLRRPDELEQAVDDLLSAPPRFDGPARIDVAQEKTGEGGRRLAAEVGRTPAILNFASAKNPGGGYVGGARAQEEDLCRSSALYESLMERREYYEANRACGHLYYTDHMIFSPSVPFYRDDAYELLAEPVTLHVITAPAPNAGEVLRREPEAQEEIDTVYRRRAGMVLGLAAHQGVEDLVLGAWGCGVFRNEPARAAAAFRHWLEQEPVRRAFRTVRFSIYDSSKARATLAAFSAAFEPGA